MDTASPVVHSWSYPRKLRQRTEMLVAEEQNRDRSRGWLFSVDNRQVRGGECHFMSN